MPHYYVACDFGAESGRVILGELDEGQLTLSEIHRFPNVPVQERSSLHWDIPRLYAEMLAGLSSLPVTRSAATIGGWLGVFGFQLSVILTVLAGADYGWQRWRHERSLRMTKQEVREEQRDAEGRGRSSAAQRTPSRRAVIAGRHRI